MKKTLFICLTVALAMFGTFAKAQNVNIPDDNFKAYLVGNSNINTNGDNEISFEEAAAFSGTINCSDKGIADLTGIEAFTALKGLSCYQNQLTSLDISANTALTYLQCSKNQLTSLDVSANTALEDLYCYHNEITSLDVSSNPALLALSCSGNQIASLDVSSNTQLETLVVSLNPITSLDVRNNPALSGLSVTYTQVVTLDLRSNGQIVSLEIDNNSQLASVDFRNGNNQGVDELFATGNPNLHCILVDDASWAATHWTYANGTIDYWVNFSENAVEIIASVLPANSGIVTGAQGYCDGSEATLMAIPEAGFVFKNWTEDGTEVSTEATYTFTATADRELVAHFELSTGITELVGAGAISIYPNPVRNELTIEIQDSHEQFQLVVVNIMGQVVYRGTIVQSSIVPMNGLAPGIYLIRLQSQDQVQTFRIVKE